MAGDSVLTCQWGAACPSLVPREKLQPCGRESVSEGTVCWRVKHVIFQMHSQLSHHLLEKVPFLHQHEMPPPSKIQFPGLYSADPGLPVPTRAPVCTRCDDSAAESSSTPSEKCFSANLTHTLFHLTCGTHCLSPPLSGICQDHTERWAHFEADEQVIWNPAPG